MQNTCLFMNGNKASLPIYLSLYLLDSPHPLTTLVRRLYNGLELLISDCTHWNITLTVAQRVNIKINNSSQTGIVVKQRRTRIVVNPIVVRRTGPYENRGNYGKSGQTGQWSNPDQPMPLTGQSEFQHAQVYRPAPQCAPRHHFCCTSPPCVRVYACARVRMSTGRKRRRRAAAKSAPPPVPAPTRPAWAKPAQTPRCGRRRRPGRPGRVRGVEGVGNVLACLDAIRGHTHKHTLTQHTVADTHARAHTDTHASTGRRVGGFIASRPPQGLPLGGAATPSRRRRHHRASRTAARLGGVCWKGRERVAVLERATQPSMSERE